jgi:hypothetical protein
VILISENGRITALDKVECVCAFDANSKAGWFEFEEDKMYSRRKSELP